MGAPPRAWYSGAMLPGRIGLLACSVCFAACDGESDLGSAEGRELPPGQVIELPESDAAADPCLELDFCPEQPDGGAAGSGGTSGASGSAGAGGGDASAGAGGSTPDAGSGGPQVGSKLLVRTYAYLRKSASDSAGVVESIAPNGGIDDANHPGQPLGLIPPGQEVTVEAAGVTNGYYNVRYDGKVGFVGKQKVVPLDESVHAVERAMKPEARDAFFKRQVRWAKYNQDGPSSSSNCGPTSMAMARSIFRKEPSGLSVEQSIHKVRAACCGLGDSDATSSTELVNASEKLGLAGVRFGAFGSNEATLDNMDQELDKKRVFMLRGRPGLDYRAAMTAAHKAAGVSYKYTFGVESDDFHFILVVGRLSSGKYVVADPLSRVGMVEIGRPDLKSYINESKNGSGVSWRAAK